MPVRCSTAHPGLSLIGIDTDAAAIEESRQILAAFTDRVTLVQAVYDELPQILADAGLSAVQGILFDLGVSSPQLDSPSRGFAYAQDAPLDMRMNQASELTAADVVNTYPADRLARVLREYGEERFARRIAAAVVRERAREPLTSTARLADIVGPPSRRPRGGLAAIRRSGRSRRCGSRLTASSRRCAGRCPQRWMRSPLVAGSWCLPITRSRTARSSGSWQRGRPIPRQPGCRFRWRPPGRSSGCSPGALSGQARTSWRRTHARHPPGCGRPSGSGRRHEETARPGCQSRPGVKAESTGRDELTRWTPRPG